KQVQKDIINAANKFNEDMSVYVTSGFDTDKLTNVTNDFKKNLTGIDANFKAIKEHVEKIESQFLESTVNMDDLDLSLYEVDWKTEVNSLVSNNEKIKIEQRKDFEDVSYQELRNLTLTYDNDQGKWMVDDLSGKSAEGSEADDWDNKKEIKTDNPPVRNWPKKDSFI